MKKILLAVVALLCVAAVNAQDYKNSIGLRLGYGAEVQYERHFSAENYLEVNAGLADLLGSFDRLMVNATYNWNCFDWDWTPSARRWFLSAGVGGSVGFWGKDAKCPIQVGVSGNVAFGIRFNAPVTLSLDYRPTIYFLNDAWVDGVGHFGLTCTYNF